ncbi:hypothetical protein BDV93DRAFT_553053 [Ceratobasidium sp. AG-I]|nr:hypothetical protein BDV93DRAFT_553053 [Ceratobasidium sp. AG-I]
MPIHEPRHSSPPSTTQRYETMLDASLSNSDRSVRSMHSAPSLTSASTTPSNSNASLNVHLIPLPHSHLHIRNANDSIEYSEDGSHDVSGSSGGAISSKGMDMKADVVEVLPSAPDITITPTLEGPLLRRTGTERSVAASRSKGSTEPEAWRVSEYAVISGQDERNDDDDDNMSEAGSISASTDELRRTLFYRPSTDPIFVHSDPEPDPELHAMLNANAASNTSHLSPAPNTSADLLQTPMRPPRPPSLDLSDSDKPVPKMVDIPVRTEGGHKRMSSRERLGALLGVRPPSHSRPSQGGVSHSHSASGGTVRGTEDASNFANESTLTPVASSSLARHRASFPLTGQRISLPLAGPDFSQERAVQVHQIQVGGPRLSRARSISGQSLSMAEEMCRSVWEDDDDVEVEEEELAKGWGRIRRWLGDEDGKTNVPTSSTPAPKKNRRHVPKSLSLASTINAFRTPPISPAPAPATATTQDAKRSSHLSFHSLSHIGLGGEGSRLSLRAGATRPSIDAGASQASLDTGASRMGDSASSRTWRSARSSLRAGSESVSAASASATSAYASATSAYASASVYASARASSFSIPGTVRGSSGSSHAEPESPTMTAVRFRSASGHGQVQTRLQVPEPPRRFSFEADYSPQRHGEGDVSEFGVLAGSREQTPEPQPESRMLTPEPDESVEDTTPAALPSPPVSPSPAAAVRAPVVRSLRDPTYGSLHGRLGSPISPGLGSPVFGALNTPMLSPRTPTSPLGMGMSMDYTYRSDVRPMSGLTESSYWPSSSAGRPSESTNRGSGGHWRKPSGSHWRRESGTTGRPDSGATWAESHRQLLAPPPRVKTVRIVDASEDDRARMKLEPNHGLPTPPLSASRSNSIFRMSPVGVRPVWMRTRRKERGGVGSGVGVSPRTWFALGFVLGPWCWMIGGWMMGGRSRVFRDVEVGDKYAWEAGERWEKRCRIAAVVSGVGVLVSVLVAVVYAVAGAR